MAAWAPPAFAAVNSAAASGMLGGVDLSVIFKDF